VSYVVINGRNVEIATEPRSRGVPLCRGSVIYEDVAAFRWGIPHEGGAVVVDDASASFVHANHELPVVRLFEGSANRMRFANDRGGSRIVASGVQGRSLHCHTGIVTCGTKFGDVFVTGDDLGFVNMWRIKASVHKKQ
jgi:hypothetical protein